MEYGIILVPDFLTRQIMIFPIFSDPDRIWILLKLFESGRNIKFQYSHNTGQSTLRSCQEWPRAILCLFYCAQELPCRAVHERRITRRNKNKQRIVCGYSWPLFSIDWQWWSLETWSRSRETSRDQFFGVSVSVTKVSRLVSVSVSKDFGLGLELFVSRLCIGYFLRSFARSSL